MNFLERLRKDEILRQKNETRLSSSPHLPNPSKDPQQDHITGTAPENHQESLSEAIARRRRRQQDTTMKPAVMLPVWGKSADFLGGLTKSNEFGSYVYRRERNNQCFHNFNGYTAKMFSNITGLVSLLHGCHANSETDHVVFLDTETTGLSGGTGTYAFLVGIGSWDGSAFIVEQFFMHDFHEERAMLHALEERLKSVQVLITYNGKSFDIPLLKSRFTMARKDWPLTSTLHLDLLYPARRIWRLRFGDCSLGNLEKRILGDERTGDIEGSLIPQIYFDYTRSGSPVGIRKILEHNFLDIVTLAKLSWKVGEILHEKQKDRLSPEELFSVGNYFSRMGQLEAALDWNQEALRFPLQVDLRLKAMKSLAASYKSLKLYSHAVELWNTMIGESAGFDEDIYESLSVYYEHHEKDLGKALHLTDTALCNVRKQTSSVRWKRRRERLLRKIGKRPALFHSAL